MRPIAYLCTPRAMMPVTRFAERFDREFEVGKYYTLELVTERSPEQHGLFFKCMEVAWLNLPHALAERFSQETKQGPDDFRKFCLCVRGFCHRNIQVYETEADAKIAATQMRAVPTFVMTVVQDRTLTILIPKTQKFRRNDPEGMDKKDFKASMDACIEEAAFRIGLTVDQLVAEAKRQMVRRRAA